MADQGKTRVGLLDRNIQTWMGMKKGQPAIAMIDGLAFVFKAPSPMAAYRKADEWRKAEHLKLTSKAQRGEAA